MARPQIVNLRVQDLHAALASSGWVGKKIPRVEVERYLARAVGLSLPAIKQHVEMGRVLGLWQVIDRRPKSGALLVLPSPSSAEVGEVEGGRVAVESSS